MARKIALEIVGDSRSLEKAFARSSKSAKRFQGDVSKTSRASRSAFSGLRGAIGLATGALGVYGLTGVARAAFAEMAQAQKVSAQTGAVLESTGGAANVTAKHVDTMAESLLNLSGVDDEVIKSGENVLLTFTDIRNEAGKGNKIFDRATEATLDLSVALGQDMQRSAIQVGKALNDPIKGVGSLRRVGVQFTDAQEDQIKALVESGHKLEAQKIILQELQREFGGSAEAAGKTLPGQLNILRESLSNLGGEMAVILTPQIKKLVEQLVRWLTNTKNQKTVLDTFKTTVQVVGDVVKTLYGAFKLLAGIVGSNKRAIEILIGIYAAWKISKLITDVANLAGAFKNLAKQQGAAAAAGGAGGLGGGGRAGRVGRLGRFGRVGGAIGRAIPGVGTAIGIATVASMIPHPKILNKPGYQVAAAGGMYVANQVVHVDGGRPKDIEHELTKRRKGRANKRRGN